MCIRDRYYTKPLAPEQTTTNFMDGIYFKESMGNGFADAVYTLSLIHIWIWQSNLVNQ